MRTPPRRIVALLTLAATGACHNPCQQVCDEIEEMATECGLSVSKDDLKQCYKEQGSQKSDAKKACNEFGELEVIQEEWTCGDLEDFWAPEAGEE